MSHTTRFVGDKYHRSDNQKNQIKSNVLLIQQ